MGDVVALRPHRDAGPDGVRALDALEAWLAEYAALGGRSPVSIDSQRRHVTATLEHVAGEAGVPVAELVLEACTRDEVAAALLAYRTAPDARYTTNPSAAGTWKSDESIRRRTSALRTFFGWCVRTDRLLRDPTVTIDAPPAKPPLPKAFTEAEARAILTAAMGGPWPERDVAVVSVALGCGPRLAELAGMSVPDVHGDPPGLITVLGKGRKERRLALNPLASSALATYLKSRSERLRHHAIDERALWLACRPRRHVGTHATTATWSMGLSRTGMADIIDRCLRDAGVRRPGQRVHALRHTFATLALASHAYTLRELQEALGHESLATTGRYIKVTSDDLVRAAAAHPLAR